MWHRFTHYALLPLGFILAISLAACAGKPEPALQPGPVLQPGSTLQWYKTFGGGEGNSVLQTTDGGYIVCGTTGSYSAPESYIYLIKTDANGNKLWDKAFNAEFEDMGRSVQQTADGGYIVCGTTTDGAGGEDVRLIKTDAYGNTLWDKTFGGKNSDDEGFSVQQTTDGGYIVCGTTYSSVVGGEDVRLIKTDAEGNALWDKTFGGSDWDSGRSVQQTADGGYIVCGSTESSDGGADIWLIKTDANGNKLWDKTFGSENGDVGNSVRQTTDGGYIVCASTIVYGGGYEYIWLIKTDEDGNKLWDKTFGGKGAEEGLSVQRTTDGGYIICGETTSYGAGDRDLWLIKTDADGNKLWDKTFGGQQLDEGHSVQQTTDGGYIVCGATDSYGSKGRVVLLLKIAPER
jgi:hypothetical protein